MSTIIHKVAAMVIKDNAFLMVRKVGKDVWTNLGGHIEDGETEEQALIRETKEELDCEGTIIRKLGDFRAKAAFDDAELVLSTYLMTLNGELKISDPELEKFRFIGKHYKEEGIQLPDSIESHVLPYCIKEGLLNW
jgi:8-oxo-dGTP diphosphatase